jgi:hypothetical protein
MRHVSHGVEINDRSVTTSNITAVSRRHKINTDFQVPLKSRGDTLDVRLFKRPRAAASSTQAG